MTFRILACFLICSLAAASARGQKQTSPSYDVEHYHISLDFSDMSKKTLKGETRITLRRLDNSGELAFDLLGPKATNVSFGDKKLKFSQKDGRLSVELPGGFPTEDTATIAIAYEGSPPEPSRFGGVYFSDTMIYNLGVTIGDIPHNYGKVWFPCQDNFTDKATYSYRITAPKGYKAVANGVLTDSLKQKDGGYAWEWKLGLPVSTYLASFAVARYVAVKDIYKGMEGEIPISIYVLPGQEADAGASFANLKKGLAAFEEMFGPYVWPRVGYVAVTMQGGAMEHATNVAYPQSHIDGTDKHDRLWAHELSHSWFGNLVTCASAGDMWLNEGFARYCEALYFERIKGEEAFRKYVQFFQSRVLRRTHIVDGGYFSVANIPESITYGSTVYDKGAMVAHTLRYYLGEERFFELIRQYMKAKKFGNATSEDFRQIMGMLEPDQLNNFFIGWVYSPGFPLYRLESWRAERAEADSFRVALKIEQRGVERGLVTRANRFDALALAADGREYRARVFQEAPDDSVVFSAPFEPAAVILDPDANIMDAGINQLLDISSPDSFPLPNLDLKITAEAVGEIPARVQATYEFHQVLRNGASPAERSWRVAGLTPEGFRASAVFDANPAELFQPNVLRDAEENGKKPALFYREKDFQPWEKIAEAKDFSSKKQIRIETGELKTGQYAVFLE